MAEEKKIIIDEDWKKQAQQEKEVQAKKAKEEVAEESEAQSHGRSGPLPRADFPALINMLTTQALFAMGVFQVKDAEPREPDMELARYNIDMLEALQDKTKGNLSSQEAALLKDTLNQLRMGYVQIAEGGQDSDEPGPE